MQCMIYGVFGDASANIAKIPIIQGEMEKGQKIYVSKEWFWCLLLHSSRISSKIKGTGYFFVQFFRSWKRGSRL